MDNLTHPAVIVAFIVVMQIVFAIAMAKRYRRVGPNEALVISGGQRGTRIVKGGGTFVWPIIEGECVLSLEVTRVPLSCAAIPTRSHATVALEGAVQVKIGGDESSIRAAAECLLSKSREEIGQVVRDVMDRRLRAVAETMETDAIAADREGFTLLVEKAAAADLEPMGLRIEAFVLQKVAASPI